MIKLKQKARMMKDILNVDCMDKEKGLPSFKDNFFDLAIVDPPYGLNFANERERKPTKTRSAQFRFGCKNWDKSKPTKEYFIELMRTSKHQIIWGGNYFLDYLNKTKCIIIWDKLNPDGMRFSDGEMAWASFELSLRIYKSERTYKKEIQFHPTQKPVALYKWLLKNYAKPEFKILDTHGGSMSSVIAMDEFGCDYVVFEIDTDYYNSAMKRIKIARQQLKMF